MNSDIHEEPVWSVSEVNAAVKEALDTGFQPFWICGEVSGLNCYSSGHAYLTLKDEKSQIRACFFGGVSVCRRMKLADGMKIEAYGRLSAYPPRGEYNFSIRQLRIAGAGSLQRQFEEIKQRLAKEGVFNNHREIPLLPRVIGIVSSPNGAAICDVVQIISRRFSRAHLRLFPARVQGAGAEADLIAGIEFFSRPGNADVVIITRGGGSIEDLWCFNDENLARRIAACPVPVISAVGHEIDFTICDFAADLRAPTPSGAAELVIAGAEELLRRLDTATKSLVAAPSYAVAKWRERLSRPASSFVFTNPLALLENPSHRVDDAWRRLLVAATEARLTREKRLEQLAASLTALDPQRQLERGYIMAVDPATGKLITAKSQGCGKSFNLRFSDGTLPVKALE